MVPITQVGEVGHPMESASERRGAQSSGRLTAGKRECERARQEKRGHQNGMGGEYWFQRGTKEDAGASFMGFGAGLGPFSGD